MMGAVDERVNPALSPARGRRVLRTLHAVVEVCPCANHCCCAYRLSCYADARKAEAKARAPRQPGEMGKRVGEVSTGCTLYKGTSIGHSIKRFHSAAINKKADTVAKSKRVCHCSGM